MTKRKLHYIFHNPNTEKLTEDYLLKILIEANTKKVETRIQAEAICEEKQNEE